MPNYKIVVNASEDVKASILTTNNVCVAHKTIPSGNDQNIVFELPELDTITIVGEKADGRAVSLGKITPTLTEDQINTIRIKSSNDTYFEEHYVAFGDIEDNTRVCLRQDGKVEVVNINYSNISITENSAIDTVQLSSVKAIKIASNKIAVVYYTPLSYLGKIVIGTISSGNITFGAAQQFATNVRTVGIGYNSSIGRLLLVYCTYVSTYSGYVMVGSVSGSTVTFGTAVLLSSGYVGLQNILFHSLSGKLVMAYKNGAAGNTLIRFLTISNLTPTLQTAYIAATVFPSEVVADIDQTTGKILIVWYNNSATPRISARTCIPSTADNTITLGTEIVISNAIAYSNICLTNHPNLDNFLLIYKTETNLGQATLLSCSDSTTVKGNTITFSNTYVQNTTSYYDSQSSKITCIYQYGLATYHCSFGIIEGNVVKLDDGILLNKNTEQKSAVFDSTTNLVFCFYNNTASYITSAVITPTIPAPNVSDFIGITQETVSNGQEVLVITKGGIVDGFSNLITDTTYFLNSEDELVTSLPIPGYELGVAISSTKMLLRQ